MPANDPRPRRRERSHRYPGVPLAEAIELARVIDRKGLDGLPAGPIAEALGIKNIRTPSFSSRLSAARQFGLIALREDGYALTELAREILHPVDPAGLPRLHRRALLEPPLYAELAVRLSGRPVPDAPALANLLYHHHHITASAKEAAAAAFLDSARFADALGPDGIFRPDGGEPPPANPSPPSRPDRPPPRRSTQAAPVRLDLRLWGADQGKIIRLRAPESISRESFERFLQAFRLHVRIEEGDPEHSDGG